MITKENVSILKPKQTFFIGNVQPDYETEALPKRTETPTNSSLIADKRKDIQDSIKLHSNISPRLLADLGKINGDRGKTKAAKKAFASAIAQNPKNIAVRVRYVDTLIKLKRFDDALEQMSHIQDIAPKDSRISIKKLQLLLDLSYLDMTASHYYHDFLVTIEKHIKNFDEDYRAYNLRGLFQALVQKDLLRAEQSFQKALKIERNYVSLTNLGSCNWDLNNLSTARKYFKKAIEFNKDEEIAHINLINLCISEKKYEEALEYIDESEGHLSPSGASYLYQKGWLLLESGRVEEALEWNLKILKDYPDNFKIYNNIGNCYEKLGNVDEAFRNYFKSIQLSKKTDLLPEDLKQYYNALMLARVQKDNDRSIRIAEQLIEIDPNNIPALYTIANIKLHSKQFKDAKTDFKKIIQLDPTTHDAYVSLSFIYTEIEENHEDAILLLESADLLVDKTEEGDEFYNNLTYAYIKSGLLDKAEKVLSKTKGSAHSLSTRALLCLYKGDETNYDLLFKQSLGKFKGNDATLALQSFYFEKAFHNSVHSIDSIEKVSKLLDEVISIDDTSYFADKASRLKSKIFS